MPKNDSQAHYEPDRFDLAILDILQRDNTVSLQEIGRTVNLSAPAVQRRIKRLRSEKIIQKDVSIVDPISVGRPITIVVAIEMDNEKIEALDETKEAFQLAPEVQQCYYVTGEADFILILTVSDMKEYEMLTRTLFFSNSNIKKFRTFVNMESVKSEFRLPIV